MRPLRSAARGYFDHRPLSADDIRMIVTGRRMLLALCVVIAAAGIVLWIDPAARWLALVAAACALLAAFILNAMRPVMPAPRRTEPAELSSLTQDRQRELIRGTSLSLREMHYRYSVRFDAGEGTERRPFITTVNTITLAFIPAVITDNTTDRQGFGFVAFVHDGARFRGPGLPCPGTREDAVAHAIKCVSPLAE